MTLIIQKPTGAKLVFRKELPADTDADNYIAAVEAADGQALESGVKFAIKNFVLCCKDDGIWPAIKASCILAGARTLTGALVPLVGSAPTNVNFVSGDYNRKTGLVGNGSTKYLNSNRAGNADPQNSFSLSVYITTAATTGIAVGVGGAVDGSNTLAAFTGNARNRTQNPFAPLATGFIGFFGTSRASSSGYQYRRLQSSQTITEASQTPLSNLISIYANTDQSNFVGFYTNARMSFYSIGESLDLALLDARVTDLVNAIGAAIP
jgi:hypothetical protein